MSRWDLPDAWEWATAGEIADIVGGGTPAASDATNFEDGGFPWVTPADLSSYIGEYVERGARSLSAKGLASSSARRMPAGAVLFTSRAPIGYCVIAANEIATNQGFKSLVLKGGIDPRFVRHYLLASKDYAESLSSGSTFRELSGSRMADLEIPVPPLQEQRRIAARIEELQTRTRRAREALEGVPALLEQFRQSVLASAFRGDLTADWRESHPDVEPAAVLLERVRAERRRQWEAAELEKMRAKGKEPKDDRWKRKYKEPEPVDTSGLPELPEGWAWTTWNHLSEWVTYGFTRPMPHVADGPPIVTAKNVVAGAIAFENNHRTSQAAFEALSDKDRPLPGDILITKDGTIGRAAVVPECEPFCINQSVAVVFLRGCPIQRSLLLRTIEAPATQGLIREAARGMAIPHLSITDFGRMPVPVPPEEEQVELVCRLEDRLRRLENLASVVGNLSARHGELEQAVLTRAFRGELATQNPNDEPASVLLERIRQEREQQRDRGRKS